MINYHMNSQRSSNDSIPAKIDLPISMQNHLDALRLKAISSAIAVLLTKLKKPIGEQDKLILVFCLAKRAYSMRLSATGIAYQSSRTLEASQDVTTCEVILEVNRVNATAKRETLMMKLDMNQGTHDALENELKALSESNTDDHDPPAVVVEKDTPDKGEIINKVPSLLNKLLSKF